ncbi:hypothetical protein [Rheinheimera sp.]|uniref:hypothetical protein n=1 Tax=Rheinheimera sp. TaxID=1869214 RepID=UPI004048907B
MDRLTQSVQDTANNNSYHQRGTVSSGMNTFARVVMARNITFVDVRSMLAHAYDKAAQSPGRWQIVAQGFVQDKAICVEGFLVVERDRVLYTPYSPHGEDLMVTKECAERRERPEKVIQHKLFGGAVNRRNLIEISSMEKSKVINTLLSVVYRIFV